MQVLDAHIANRRSMHSFYAELCKNIPGVSVFEEPSEVYFSNHWLSCIVIDPEKSGRSREGLRLALEADDIESRPLWKPMHLQPVF